MDTENAEEADELGSRAVLDLDPEEALEGMDVSLGADVGDQAQSSTANRSRLLEMARQAEALMGDKDQKLIRAVKFVKDFLRDGFSPIVFCRFIDTAEYVAEELRTRLGMKDVEIAAVTGRLPPEERELRIRQLTEHPRHVLVCTDCLSEGVNLQVGFDAVMHYDLSWNPTRHEQRAGRVDRYGQRRPAVRVLTYYGKDNPMDGIILEVLLKKHKLIKSRTGVSVSLPADTKQVMQALMEGLLLRGKQDQTAYLDFMYDGFEGEKQSLHMQWEAAAERRSRTIFAQQSIKVDEVAGELQAVQSAIGSGVDVRRFIRDAVAAHSPALRANARKRAGWRSGRRPPGRKASALSIRCAKASRKPLRRSAQGSSRTRPTRRCAIACERAAPQAVWIRRIITGNSCVPSIG